MSPFRSTSRRATAVAAAALFALSLGACAAIPAEGTGEQLEGGTIRYAHLQEPPCVFGGWIQQAYLSRQVLDSLVTQTEDGEIVPWLATDWEVSDDQKVYTFTLKDGVSFTDGTPVDAQAIVDNFEYWVAGGNSTVTAYIENYYESSRAIDATTFELTLTKPYSPLLSVITQAYFGIQSPASLERSAEEQCDQPIGSGPFIVGDWKRGENISFSRNDDYNSAPATAKHEGPAYVDSIVWSFLADPTTRYGSLLSGESDVVYDIPSVNWVQAGEQFERLQYITPGRPDVMTFNTSQGVFSDELLRKAFTYSLDRKTIVDSVFNGAALYEPNGAVSQSTPGYDASIADDYSQDLDKANDLLDEAGWTETDDEGYRTKDGAVLEVRIPVTTGSILTQEGATVLQIVQQQAREVGFKVTLIPVTQSELFSGAYSTVDAYDISVGYWTAPTAGIMYINFRQNLPESPNYWNGAFYNNPELEAIIVQANSTLDKTEQDALYAKAQQIISDHAVAIGLYTQTTTLAISRSLKDVWLEASQGEPVLSDAYFVG